MRSWRKTGSGVALMAVLCVAVLAGCVGTSGGENGPSAEVAGPFGEREGRSASDAAATDGAYLQQGGDAARTGSLGGTGPMEYEIILATQLPGARVEGAPPIHLDGIIYVLVQAHTASPGNLDPPEGLTENGLFRVDPAAGVVAQTPVVAFDAPPSAMASDGEMLYIAEAQRVAAYSLDGEEQWDWMFPELLPDSPERTTRCVPPAVVAGSLFLACTQIATNTAWNAVHGDPAQLPQDGGQGASAAFVVRLDGGDATWRWPPDLPDSSPVDPGNPAAASEAGGPCTVDGRSHTAHGVVATDEHVIAIVAPQPDPLDQAPVHYLLHDFEASSGDRRWTLCLDSHVSDVLLYGNGEDFAPGRPAVAVQGETAFVVHDDVMAVDLEDGTFRFLDQSAHNSAVGPTRGGQQNNQAGLVAFGNSLFVQQFFEVLRLDLSTPPEKAWRQPVEASNYRHYQPLLAAGVLYVPTYYTVMALDAGDGSVRWIHGLDRPTSLENLPDMRTAGVGVADGMLSIVEADGRVVVMGRTGASIQPDVAVSDRWPPPGETVAVDLSGTEPGAAGGELEYRADWGDGFVTAWESEPRFTHAYDVAQVVTARFSVIAKDAEGTITQRSVETITFDVGGSPPAESNMLQTAFARENQDLTFGILGILVAVLGGLIAIAARARRRGRLQKELDAIDRLVERTDGRPPELAAVVQERRAHARGLVVDGYLEEGQSQILERHLDDVLREGRLDEAGGLFDALPHGLVRHLRDVLGDGRVSRLERDSLLTLVDQAGLVPDDVKAEVRTLVDEWFRRDAGASR